MTLTPAAHSNFPSDKNPPLKQLKQNSQATSLPASKIPSLQTQQHSLGTLEISMSNHNPNQNPFKKNSQNNPQYKNQKKASKAITPKKKTKAWIKAPAKVQASPSTNKASSKNSKNSKKNPENTNNSKQTKSNQPANPAQKNGASKLNSSMSNVSKPNSNDNSSNFKKNAILIVKNPYVEKLSQMITEGKRTSLIIYYKLRLIRIITWCERRMSIGCRWRKC